MPPPRRSRSRSLAGLLQPWMPSIGIRPLRQGPGMARRSRLPVHPREVRVFHPDRDPVRSLGLPTPVPNWQNPQTRSRRPGSATAICDGRFSKGRPVRRARSPLAGAYRSSRPLVVRLHEIRNLRRSPGGHGPRGGIRSIARSRAGRTRRKQAGHPVGLDPEPGKEFALARIRDRIRPPSELRGKGIRSRDPGGQRHDHRLGG